MSKKYLFLIAILIVAVFAFSTYALVFRRQRLSGPAIAPFTPWFANSIDFIAPTKELPEIINLDQVFSGTSVNESDGQQSDLVTLMVTGDVLLAREVNRNIQARRDPTWPFLNTASELQKPDLTLINLETPLIPDCPVRSDGMVFCGANTNVSGLTFAGVDLVNIANNHMANWGANGVQQTVQTLQNANLKIVGYKGPIYQEIKGIKFAFLGYNDVGVQPGVAHAETELLTKEIAEANINADVVVVQFHWGEEYRYQPTARQKAVAHQAVDLGADLIVSNHPHWFQALEFYNNKLIMYSHGNFVFDQMWSRETREGIVGKYTFQKNKLVGVEFLPVLIENYGQPRWMVGEEKEKILKRLLQESIVFTKK